MDIYKIKAKDILSWTLTPWYGQRGINMDWVSELKKQQYHYMSTTQSYALIPGSFIIVECNNIMYLVDGQHRYELIRQMVMDGMYLDNTYITVEIYLCPPDSQQACAIFNMVNSRYGANGIVVDDSIVIILDKLRKKYPNQCEYRGSIATNAPLCNLDTLSREIKDSDILRKIGPEEVYNSIVIHNDNYAPILYGHNQTQYTKCCDKSGFYLPYKGSNCSWFGKLIKEFFPNT